MKLKLFLTLFILGIQSQAAEYREFYTGVRALGMGGASIAVVNDETALLSNPAALGKVRDFYGTLIDPEIDVTEKYWSLYNSKPFSNPLSIEKLAATLDKKREKYYHYRQQIFPSIVVRNFGMGIFSKSSLDAEMNADGTSMRVDYYQDVAFALGYNFRFFDGRVKLGFTEKFIARVEVAEEVDPSGNLKLKSLAKEGAGLSTDVGLILTAPWKLLPTLAIVAHDIGGNSFSATSGVLMKTDDRPTPLSQDYDIAVAIFPIHNPKLRSSWTLEYKGVSTASDDPDAQKRLHFGGEVNIADTLFLRAGMNQRYYTLGFELATEHTQLQFAFYGEEIGTADENREDRRFVSKFAIRF